MEDAKTTQVSPSDSQTKAYTCIHRNLFVTRTQNSDATDMACWIGQNQRKSKYQWRCPDNWHMKSDLESVSANMLQEVSIDGWRGIGSFATSYKRQYALATAISPLHRLPTEPVVTLPDICVLGACTQNSEGHMA